ncbi:MAG: TonB-dependent receptor, partial [Bacteroidota bacterium]
GDRIPYANVSIVSLSKGAATNSKGFYLIPSVAPGSYEIAASAVGYVRQVKRVVVQGTKAITVNFLLPPEPVRLEEVVVTGRGKRELSEISTSVHVLEKADLRMVPVTVQEDILRSILILPGIVSTSDVNSQFYVRGGAADQNLILLDGMRIYNPFHAFGLFSIFDPDVVKTAEVYTGAFPADFGGRLSSVINIATRDGKSSGYAARSNLNFLSSKVQLEGPVAENVQVIATGRKSLFSDTFKKFLRQSVPLSFYDALMKLTLKNPNSQDRYSAQAFVSRDDLKSGKEEEPDYSWTNKTLGFETNTLLQDRLFVNTLVSAGEFKQMRDAKSSEGITPASTSVREFSVRANATYYTDSKDLYFFGFEFSFPNVEYDFVTRFGVPTKLESTVPQFSSWVRYQM